MRTFKPKQDFDREREAIYTFRRVPETRAAAAAPPAAGLLQWVNDFHDLAPAPSAHFGV